MVRGADVAEAGSTFLTPGTIITGRGSLERLGACVGPMGRRALVVTGRRAMRRVGVLDRIIRSLEGSGCGAVVFDEVPPEPTLTCVDAGRRVFFEAGCDVVIGAGGGSVLDVAKAIGGLSRSAEPTGIYLGGRALPAEGAPIAALPTTAGTGAEVTLNSVLVDPDVPVKQSIRGNVLMPRVALVDPELTVSMPPAVTARSGMDALTQAIEGYWSRGATPLTDALALQAIDLIVGHLQQACEHGEDLDAREAMAYGSLLGGMCFANARLGAVHGLAHPLGVRCRIPHGEVCAVLLPHVMRLNRQSAQAKYDRISKIVGCDGAEFAARLLALLGLPTTLAHVGLSRADFDTLVAESMPSGSLKSNPKTVTEDDLIEILTAVL
jgi:alcohol dehydrogenase class IV